MLEQTDPDVVAGQDVVEPFVEVAVRRETHVVEHGTTAQDGGHGLWAGRGFKAETGATPDVRGRWLLRYLQGAVLVPGDLVVPVTVAVQGREHDAEGAGPLTEEDEEMMPQRLLGEQEAPVVD